MICGKYVKKVEYVYNVLSTARICVILYLLCKFHITRCMKYKLKKKNNCIYIITNILPLHETVLILEYNIE